MTTHEKRLARFIRRVGVHQDTPDLIMIIAADADHLWACRSIVAPATPSGTVPASTLRRLCRQQGWRVDDLREKLAPAARALGIMPAVEADDHYRVLGVREKATVHEIRQAFRNRAFDVHPDTASDGSGGHESFQDLCEAYYTLRDPARRRSYDTDRRRWRESPARLLGADGRASVYRWYLGGLTIIFIILLLLTIIIN